MTIQGSTVRIPPEGERPPEDSAADGTLRITQEPAKAGSTTSASGVRAWSASHPLTAFLAVAFGIAYPVMAVPILAGHGVIWSGWMPQGHGVDTERIASVLLVFVALVPAAVFVTWAAEGHPGVRRLLSRSFRWRIGAGWWVLVVAGLPVLTLALAVLFGDTLTPVEAVPFVTTQVLGLLVNLVLINIWEETAWSGVVQTRLERRHSLVAAALLTAVPFALAHMPLHFIGDFTLGSVSAALVTLLIVCAVVRVLLGVVLRGTRDSVLAVAVMHTMFNRSNNDEGIVAGVLEGDGRKLAGLVAVLMMTVLVSIIARRRLGRAERLRLDGTHPHAASPSAHEEANS